MGSSRLAEYRAHSYQVTFFDLQPDKEPMSSIDSVLPDYLIERSLAFKSFVIVAGALLLLSSTFLRDSYPKLWILPFLGGALIEWLVVLTVYTEMSQMERMIENRKEEIEETQSDIESTKREIEDTQAEIEEAKDNIFSFISDSQGPGANDSIEDRVSELEDEVGVGTFSRGGLSDKVQSLQRQVKELKRDRNKRW
jgi:archaellum component FlaC